MHFMRVPTCCRQFVGGIGMEVRTVSTMMLAVILPATECQKVEHEPRRTARNGARLALRSGSLHGTHDTKYNRM